MRYKRQWEAKCLPARRARKATERVATRLLKAHGNSGQVFLREGFDYLLVNSGLSRKIAASVGLECNHDFGPFLFDQLKTRLAEASRLSTKRPTSVDEAEAGHIIYEETIVTKVIFPHETLKLTVPSIRELAVWISDPASDVIEQPRESMYDFSGTFLYLITPLYQDAQLATFYSGCSALQAVSNLISGRPFVETDWSEPLGRRSFMHPIEKVKSIGGIVVDRRRVESLYRPRYMSDEQNANDGKRMFRVHDLLAYPLYIGNAL